MITKYSDLKNKFKRLKSNQSYIISKGMENEDIKRKYLESIQLIIKGIKLAEELNDLELLIILKKKLASIYISIERYKEAIEVLEQLKEVFMLIDFRHKPSSDDILMYKYLKYYNLKVTVVATKIDKISFGQREKYKNIILNTLELQEGDKLVLFSSVTKDGKKEIYGEIEKYLDFIDE